MIFWTELYNVFFLVIYSDDFSDFYLIFSDVFLMFFWGFFFSWMLGYREIKIMLKKKSYAYNISFMLHHNTEQKNKATPKCTVE